MKLKYRKEHKLLNTSLTVTDLAGVKRTGIVRRVSDEEGLLFDFDSGKSWTAQGYRVWLEVEGRKSLLKGPFFAEHQQENTNANT